jgi:hypothetical protein
MTDLESPAIIDDLCTLRASLRVEIHAISADLRLLKAHWRTPPAARGEPPPTRLDLWRSKQRATLLCMLMAHSRGRRHVPVWLRGHTEAVELPDLAAQAAFLAAQLERKEYCKPLLEDSLRSLARIILTRRAMAA